jgi:hypothetical protein
MLTSRPWSQEDRLKLIEVYATIPVAELAVQFGRSQRSIASQAYKWRLKQDPALKSALGKKAHPRDKPRGLYRYWNKADRDLAMKLYPTTPTVEIAAKFGRSVRSVRYLAIRLGKKKLTSSKAKPQSVDDESWRLGNPKG